jgi:hypothetical protein
MNENILTDNISQVLTNEFLSSKKEVEVGYVKDSRDDDNNTQATSPHPLVHLNAIRLKKDSFA